MIKKIIRQGYDKNNNRISVIERIEKNEMTSMGIFLVVDGDEYFYHNVETAIYRFNQLTK